MRATVVEMSHRAGSPHLGSCLSCVDILVAAYWGVLDVDPANARIPSRDRFILSKGHAAPALYAVLAERGFFPRELLDRYDDDGADAAPSSPRPAACRASKRPPARSATACRSARAWRWRRASSGRALPRVRRHERRRVQRGLGLGGGDARARARARTTCASIVDYNKWQATGRSDEIMALAPLAEKWRAFGWSALEVDGHDLGAIVAPCARSSRRRGKPVAIIAHTVKGKGVSFMEDDNNWHYRIPTADEVTGRHELGDRRGTGRCMRNAFADEITALARAPTSASSCCRATSATACSTSSRTSTADRFYNCGVAEANMMGVAAGLAMCGLRPVVYTITPFITTRCLEQIRVDVCYHHLPVVIVGTGAGLSLCVARRHAPFLRGHRASAGPARHDRRLSRRRAGGAAARCARRSPANGPVYLRIGKKGEPVVHAQPPEFAIGKVDHACARASDVCLLGTGTMLPLALERPMLLASARHRARVESFHTVKPLDEALLAECSSTLRVVATIEEHSSSAGSGGAVAEWLADRAAPVRALLRARHRDGFLHEAGSQEHARAALRADGRRDRGRRSADGGERQERIELGERRGDAGSHPARRRLRQYARLLRRAVSPARARARSCRRCGRRGRTRVTRPKPVRDHLRARRHAKTCGPSCRAFAYGERIDEARPFPARSSSCARARERRGDVRGRSHKTRVPVRGRAVRSARGGPGLAREPRLHGPVRRSPRGARLLRVHARREDRCIAALGCTHFVDDLAGVAR